MIETRFDQLRERIQGHVYNAHDAGYADTCALFNAAIERAPAVVVRASSVEDVVEAIRFARASGLPLSVRSGGHSAAGWSLCDGGLVVDMRDIDSIEVDPNARVAKVGGGCLTGAVDRACQAHGLATVTGRVSTTGIAGFTLGGGSGMLERRHGFREWTTYLLLRSSPPTGGFWWQTSERTPISSGHYAVAAVTTVW